MLSELTHFLVKSSSTFTGFSTIIVLATSLTNSTNLSFLATKSVSELISSTTPILFAESTTETTIPSAAILPDFFAAAASPFSLRISIAFSISPLASTKAFLQSIIPQAVLSRRTFTSLAVKFIFIPPKILYYKGYYLIW